MSVTQQQALADIAAAQAAIGVAVTAAITEIQALAAQVAALGSAPTADQLEAIATGLNAQAAALTAAIPVVSPPPADVPAV